MGFRGSRLHDQNLVCRVLEMHAFNSCRCHGTISRSSNLYGTYGIRLGESIRSVANASIRPTPCFEIPFSAGMTSSTRPVVFPVCETFHVSIGVASEDGCLRRNPD